MGVDIFFDTKDEALVVTNGKGEFHNAGIYAPRSARPGQHWVTALERNNDKGAQEAISGANRLEPVPLRRRRHAPEPV